MAGAVAVLASSVIGCITAKMMLRRTEAHVEDDSAAMAVRYPEGATTIGGEWTGTCLHDAKSRFCIMQTFAHMMFSSMSPGRLCLKFNSELRRLFCAKEVFVYLALENSIMPSERSATRVVMMEGKVLALSKTNTHPDVKLLPEEDTVLAVPIFLPDNLDQGSVSSLSFLDADGNKLIYGCVELVNRRKDTKMEEDLELLYALGSMLCHATMRVEKLKDAIMITHDYTSLPPLTQVEFFGETSIIPEKGVRQPMTNPTGLHDSASVGSWRQQSGSHSGVDGENVLRRSGSCDKLGARVLSWEHLSANVRLEPETGDGQKVDCIDGDDFPLQMSPEVLIEAEMQILLDWSFDVLQYDIEQLVHMAVNVFDFFHLTENFGIARTTLRAFITTVMNMYQEAPFHNHHHAFHVFQNCLMFLYSVSELKECLSSLDAFSLLVASLCHDMDHTGTNNTYHINTWSPLSIRYNDMSVMEQHHAALCFVVLTNPQTNIVRGLTPHSRSIMRKTICHAILSTDMNNHTKNLESFVARRCLPFQKGLLSDRMQLVGMLLHTADLGNPCMGIKHCKEWELRISHEFLFQATLETEQGLPVAPFMLKYDMLSRIENQNHFMTHFAYPQWKAMVEMFPVLAPRFNQLKSNIEYFYTLQKTLEEAPNLADPKDYEMSTRGKTSVWDNIEECGELGFVGDEHAHGDEDKRKIKRRSARGRLSRLTQPGASDLIHMWDAPKLLPDVYEMRRRGGLPDVDQEVRAYLWDEMLPPLRSPGGQASRESRELLSNGLRLSEVSHRRSMSGFSGPSSPEVTGVRGKDAGDIGVSRLSISNPSDKSPALNVTFPPSNAGGSAKSLARPELSLA